jgi:hypothetical protein
MDKGDRWGKRGEKKNRRISSLKVQRRSEVIVRIPVENGVEGAEGIIEKTEITEGIYLASSLIKIESDQATTSILNTNEKDVVVEIPTIKWKSMR